MCILEIMYSQMYYSHPRVIIDSSGAVGGLGVVDVSADVISCSVTHRMDAVSTATIALNNYSTPTSGRYNQHLHVGDKVYVSYYINDIEFPQFVGRIFSCPIIEYDAANFTIECQDCIGDLQYTLWCPYSTKAQKTFFDMNDVAIVNAAEALGENDSGIGNVFYTFLLDVCGMSKDMIHIEKFPNANDIMKNILKQCVCQTVNENQAYEVIFETLFGTYEPGVTVGNSAINGQATWQGWSKAVPIGTGVYQNAKQTGEYQEQCWDLYLKYCNYLYNLPIAPGHESPMLHQTNNNCGDYWYWEGDEDSASPKIKYEAHGYTQKAKPKTTISSPSGTQYFTTLSPSADAKQGDVVFWYSSPWGQIDGHQYGHVAIVLTDNGSTLTVENQWHGSGGVVKSTFPKNGSGWKLAGYFRPTIFDGMDGGSGATKSKSQQNQTVSQAYNDTFKLFKFLNMDNSAEWLLNSELDKYDNLYDNVPTLDYVKSMCQGSFRSYISLPDGSFCAFVPDYYGFFQQSGSPDNIVTIPEVDLVSYKFMFDKSSYKSHVFLLTNEQFGNVYGLVSDSSLNTAVRLMNSSGIVSFQRQPNELIGLMNIECAGVEQKPSGFADLMNRLGVSVLKKTDPNIVSHVMTTIAAVKMLLDAWAGCFVSHIELAFRPDLFPGLRLEIPNANAIVFIKSCTHSWSSTAGGKTTIESCATTGLNGKVGLQ